MYVCAHSTNMFAIADRKKGGKGVGGGGGGGGGGGRGDKIC